MLDSVLEDHLEIWLLPALLLHWPVFLQLVTEVNPTLRPKWSFKYVLAVLEKALYTSLNTKKKRSDFYSALNIVRNLSICLCILRTIRWTSKNGAFFQASPQTKGFLMRFQSQTFQHSSWARMQPFLSKGLFRDMPLKLFYALHSIFWRTRQSQVYRMDNDTGKKVP